MNVRANSPVTGHERLFELLLSRTQAHAPWTNEELAKELCRSVRTIERWKEGLRDMGKYPLPPPRPFKIMADQPPCDAAPTE